MNFTGNFFTLLNPYALLIGILGFVMIITHGAIYLMLKTENPIHDRAKKMAEVSWIIYIALFIVASVVTFIWLPERVNNFKNSPVLFLIPVLVLVFMIGIKIFLTKEKPGTAFVFSSLSIALLWGLAGASIFPAIVPALNDQANSLLISNSSSSELTLKTMLILAIIGVPVVLFYTIWVYKAFKGKVTGTEHGY